MLKLSHVHTALNIYKGIVIETDIAYLIKLRKEPQVIHPKLLHFH